MNPNTATLSQHKWDGDGALAAEYLGFGEVVSAASRFGVGVTANHYGRPLLISVPPSLAAGLVNKQLVAVHYAAICDGEDSTRIEALSVWPAAALAKLTAAAQPAPDATKAAPNHRPIACRNAAVLAHEAVRTHAALNGRPVPPAWDDLPEKQCDQLVWTAHCGYRGYACVAATEPPEIRSVRDAVLHALTQFVTCADPTPPPAALVNHFDAPAHKCEADRRG